MRPCSGNLPSPFPVTPLALPKCHCQQVWHQRWPGGNPPPQLNWLNRLNWLTAKKLNNTHSCCNLLPMVWRASRQQQLLLSSGREGSEEVCRGSLAKPRCIHQSAAADTVKKQASNCMPRVAPLACQVPSRGHHRVPCQPCISPLLDIG